MNEFKALSATEQLAIHLKSEIISRTWVGEMPGEKQLLEGLGVGQATVRGALRQLEEEGLLIGSGQGRRRRINLSGVADRSTLRIGILCYDENERSRRDKIELFHSLMEQGYTPFFASKTLEGLGMDVRRISGFVKQTEADAWIVNAGSRDVLQWFIEQEIPVFAQYGVQQGLPVAGIGPNFQPALRTAVRKLVRLGHHRIVSLSHRGRQKDEPRHTEKAFLDELEAQGQTCGSFNLPGWDDNQDGFRQCLESLFKLTPPSALLIEEASYLFAVMQFCGDRNLRIPQDVSLICYERAASFDFSKPSIAYFDWGYRPMVRRIVRWADNMSRGKEDKRQSRVIAKFVEGGTIGPAPPDRS